MVMKKILIALALLLTGIASGSACTGISFLAEDGGYVQARTIEWGNSYLPSEYVVVPRGQELVSYTPTGVNGLRFRAKYGMVGLAIIQKDFVAEGLNEVGLSAGLFYFPHYGKYEEYDEAQNATTLSDLQVVNWMLSQFATIDEVKAAIEGVKVVSLDKPGKSSTVHWRIGDAKGNQVVLEFVDGVPHFYENRVGVLTNSPDFPWQVTNLNNYVNLYPGAVTPQQWGGVTIFPFGAGAGFHGIPGDVTPPSRFVRVAFYKATASACPTAYDAILQSFHILNNFDIPVGIEHASGKAPDIPSATQWTSAIDLTNRKVYYKTAYNNNIRCINMKKIDFDKVKYQSYPLDKELKPYIRDNSTINSNEALDPIVENYVNVVVLPTYKDLKEKNSTLYDAVVALANNPSNSAFETACNAWITAREPWEESEAFLFGPVDELGLDPNMDSWPLDQNAIVQILNSQKWGDLEWSEGDDDAKVESAQNVRGFHTLEFLLFKDGKPRTVK